MKLRRLKYVKLKRLNTMLPMNMTTLHYVVMANMHFNFSQMQSNQRNASRPHNLNHKKQVNARIRTDISTYTARTIPLHMIYMILHKISFYQKKTINTHQVINDLKSKLWHPLLHVFPWFACEAQNTKKISLSLKICVRKIKLHFQFQMLYSFQGGITSPKSEQGTWRPYGTS